jgi:hypothetical protein
MKLKLTMMTGILLLGLVFMASYASASTWATVSIDRVGQSLGTSAGHFTHVSATPQFTNKYFAFRQQNAKEFLATALTAFSLGKDLVIRIADDGLTIDVMWIRID